MMRSERSLRGNSQKFKYKNYKLVKGTYKQCYHVFPMRLAKIKSNSNFQCHVENNLA